MSTLIGGSFAAINNPKMEYLGSFDGTNISASLGDLRSYIAAQGWASTCCVRQHVVTPTGSYAAAVITTTDNAKGSTLAPVYTGYIVAYNQSTNTWSTVVGGSNQYNPVITLNTSNNTLYYAKGYGSGGSEVYSYNFSTGVSTIIGGTSTTSGHYIYSMTVDSGNSLYVGGIFTTVSYSGFTSSSTNIGKYDGSTSRWTTVGTSPFSGASAPVRSLKANGTSIYAGSTKLYLWSGSAWGAQLGTTSTTAMMDMALNGSDLYIAAWTVYKWNGSTMTDIDGGDGRISHCNTIAVYSGSLYVGMAGWPDYQYPGWCTPMIPDYQTFGVISWGFAKTALASINWTRISGSWPNSVPSGLPGDVYSLYVANGVLSVGGDFRYTFTSATLALGLARYTTSLASFLGCTHLVNACAVDSSGNLYMAVVCPNYGMNLIRAFSTTPPVYSTYTSLGSGSNGIGKWNGTTWTNLCPTAIPNESVEAMAIHPVTGDLYVAGYFTSINGVAANYIAKWNGTAWSALGTGLGSICYALHFLTNDSGYVDLYAGGSFTTAGGATANRIARWSGSSSVWQTLVYNGNNGVNDAVLALESKDGVLYASGSFSTAGGVSTPSYAAKWTNNTWTALPAGGTYSAAMVRSNNKIYFTGGDSKVYCFNTTNNTWTTPLSRTTGGHGKVLCIADRTLDVSATNPLFVGFESTYNSLGVDTSGTDSGVFKWDGTTWDSLGSSSSYVGTNPTGDEVATIVNYAASPTVSNGAITVSNVAGTSLTLSWAKATDGVDAQSALQYRIYASGNTLVMDTVSAIEQYGTPLTGYETDIATKNITGLTEATNYIFNIIVKNTNGGKAVYTKKVQSTLDATPPVPGDGGTLTVSNPTSSTVDLGWTLATDNYDLSLQYLAYYSTNSALTSVVDIEANGTAIGSYASDISSKTGVTLAPADLYYLNVIVKDSSNNKAAYTRTQYDMRSPIPGSLGVLTTGAVTANSVVVNWTKGTDTVTAQNALQYLVYYSTSNNIATVALAEANGTPFGSYVTDIDTKTVTGLNSSTTYYFNVLIKDGDGYKSAYVPTSQITSDVTAPVVGNGGALSALASQTSITLSWALATDDITPQASLQYLAYYSLSSSLLNSVSEIEANGTAIGSYVTNINSATQSGLTAGTTYYFNVIVKDAAGNKACYVKKKQATSKYEQLLIGGDMQYLNVPKLKSNLGKWNGTTLSNIVTTESGGPTYGSSPYGHMKMVRDSLGNLYTADNSYAWKWNGSAWAALASAAWPHVLAVNPTTNTVYMTNTACGVFSLTSGGTLTQIGQGDMGEYAAGIDVDSSGNVYVGNTFNSIAAGSDWPMPPSGIYANCIAKWNGSAWSALANGTEPCTGGCAAVKCVGSNVYIIGGDIMSMSWGVYRWNGSSWSSQLISMGSDGWPNMPGTIIANGSDIYAAFGGFVVKGAGGTTWTDLGFNLAPATTIGILGTDLYVGVKSYEYMGGGVYGIYKAPLSNPTAWSAISTTQPSGSIGSEMPAGIMGSVNTMITVSSELWFGGNFNAAFSGSTPIRGFCKQTISTRTGYIGVDGSIKAIAMDSMGNLYVGGSFNNNVYDTANNATATPAYQFLKWNGTAWSAVGTCPSVGEVSSIVIDAADNIYIADINAYPNGGLYKWDGSAWTTIYAFPGYRPFIYCLLLRGSDLYVGGTFTSIGGISANYLAKWNGSTWSTVGGNVAFTDYIQCMVFDDSGNLYVGGNFVGGGSPGTRIAKWNGTVWSALGTGVNGTVYTMKFFANKLYVGGFFSSAGGTSRAYVAIWNPLSTLWENWGTSGSIPNGVLAISIKSLTEMYVGTSTDNNPPQPSLYKWNGTTWTTSLDGTDFISLY